MKKVGVIGGIGPQATMDFEHRVHRLSQQMIPQYWSSGAPPMLVFYHRGPPMRVDAADQPVFPLKAHGSILEAAALLGGWADFLVITSNGAHFAKEEIEAAAGKPVLSMIALTVGELRARGSKRVGVLGLGEPFVYLGALAGEPVHCEVLGAAQRERLDRAIQSVMEGRHGDAEREVGAEAVAELQSRDVDVVVLGCTELPFLVGETGNRGAVIDPLALLAEATVRHATEEPREATH